jgi:UMF1 family MFS transporter
MNDQGHENRIIKGDKRMINGWIIYDWANSVFQLTILSAIFFNYYLEVTSKWTEYTVYFFGIPVDNTVLYSWTIATAYLLVALFSPLLSSMADYTGRRRAFMQVFTWLGALSCGALYFFKGENIEMGMIAFCLATIGYGGSLVFYNSFLPVIAVTEDQDRISARGYSMGYLGGVILLVINLVMILFPTIFGIADKDIAARISFATVCLWWIGFAQITFIRLPKYAYGKGKEAVNIITNGYRELRVVFNYVRKSKVLTIYLLGFFFMTMGVLTVMFMASGYGKKQVGLDDTFLIPVILLLQFVGILGAWMFAKLSDRFGNFRSLLLTLIIWILICIGAYYITNGTGFAIAAFFIGLVMGGSQSLSRSTYSKLLPETTDHTSFFSFYDVMEKVATVIGLFSFGLFNHLTGSMRSAVPIIGVFFVISFIFFLFLVNKVLISGQKSSSL